MASKNWKRTNIYYIAVISLVAGILLWGLHFALRFSLGRDSFFLLIHLLLIIPGFLLFGIVIARIEYSRNLAQFRVEIDENRLKLGKEIAARTQEITHLAVDLAEGIQSWKQIGNELSRSEKMLGVIFESFHDPLSIVDREFRLVGFNDAFTAMHKKRSEQLQGARCFEVLHQKPDVCEKCVVEKTFLSGDPCAQERLITLSDGSTLWIEIYTYPIFDEKRSVLQVIEYMRDITARKRAEEENKQLIENLNYLSATDVLTGLFNRRALTDGLLREMTRAKRYSAQLSLILCDIDRFKDINDVHGHEAGDYALKAVAAAIAGILRKTDLLGRYGGDEFMVILPETALKGALLLAEKIRAAVSDIDIVLPTGDRIRPSISIGVADCCSYRDTIDSMVKMADSALYEAKQGGRNRVSLAIK